MAGPNTAKALLKFRIEPEAGDSGGTTLYTEFEESQEEVELVVQGGRVQGAKKGGRVRAFE